MRRAHTGRMLGGTVAASVTVLGLSACFIPQPPPVPTPPNADPIVQGASGSADVRDGFVPGDSTSAVVLELEERAAVVIGAASPDNDDLTLRLTGQGVDLENDDGYGEVDGFSFEMGVRDPLIGTVLEPGAYTIELAEYGGDRTGFQLQAVIGTSVVATGETAALDVAPGQPAAAIVTIATGRESITATAGFDSVLWTQVPGSARTYVNDDSAGADNPLIVLGGEEPQDIAVLVSADDAQASGAVELSVE